MNKNFLLLAVTFFCILWSCDTTPTAEIISGCTDSNSLNYNPEATIDDNSCTYHNEEFIGGYRITGNCNVGAQNTSTDYEVFIENTDHATFDLKIKNLLNRAKEIYGNIGIDDQIEIPEQEVDGDTYRGNLIIKDTDFSGIAFGSPDADCSFTGKKL